jgi:hypothetical protein
VLASPFLLTAVNSRTNFPHDSVECPAVTVRELTERSFTKTLGWIRQEIVTDAASFCLIPETLRRRLGSAFPVSVIKEHSR